MLQKRISQLLSVCLVSVLLLSSCGATNNAIGTSDAETDLQSETEQESVGTEGTESESLDSVTEFETESETETVTESKTELLTSYIEEVYKYGGAKYETDTDDSGNTTYVYSTKQDYCTNATITRDDYTYGFIYMTYIMLNETSDGNYTFQYVLRVQYDSFADLDYFYATGDNIVISAEDGTSYSYTISSCEYSYSFAMYCTDFYFDMTEDEIASMYDIMQKDGLSISIDYMNIENEYPTADLGEDTINSIFNTIDLYYELCDALSYTATE